MVNRLIFTVFLILPQFGIDVCTSHAGENIENLKAGVVKITSTFWGDKAFGNRDNNKARGKFCVYHNRITCC
jgi:hypothetical protein